MLFAGNSIAQQLTPSVISASGGFFTAAPGMLSFTIGEMTAVETFVSPTGFLTQGFQQPWDFKTAVHDFPNGQFAWTIYPNPSNGLFTCMTETDADRKIQLEVYDLLGQRVTSKTFDQHVPVYSTPLDLRNCASGIYMISLTVDEHQARLITKVEIIQ